MVLDITISKRECKASEAKQRVDNITQVDIEVFIVKWVEEIVNLPEELLRANKDAPGTCVDTSLVPEDFAVILTHATLVFKLMLVFINFDFQLVIFDSYIVSYCFVLVLLR